MSLMYELMKSMRNEWSWHRALPAVLQGFRAIASLDAPHKQDNSSLLVPVTSL